MKNFSTKMQSEAAEFQSIVERHIMEQSDVDDIVTLLKQNKIELVCTLARGSSDHAACFAKYLIETYLQILVCSFSSSVITPGFLNIPSSL